MADNFDDDDEDTVEFWRERAKKAEDDLAKANRKASKDPDIAQKEKRNKLEKLDKEYKELTKKPSKHEEKVKEFKRRQEETELKKKDREQHPPLVTPKRVLIFMCIAFVVYLLAILLNADPSAQVQTEQLQEAFSQIFAWVAGILVLIFFFFGLVKKKK